MTTNESRDADATRLPRETTPTWEVELLISGIAVFAMLQLPELLDNWILQSAPRFVDRWAKLMWFVYIYAKSAAIILAVTFVIHLLLRARWIALVGMRSIYPKGVDWDNLRLGPNAREIERARFGRMEDIIDRADNRATMVFALGVVLASILFAIALVVGTLLGAAWSLESRVGIQPSMDWLLWGIVAIVVPYAFAMGVDRKFGDKLAPDGVMRRIVRGVLYAFSKVGMGAASNPAFALLSSHHGRRRTMLLTIVVFVVAISAATMSYYYARTPEAFGSYDAFPDADDAPARAIDMAHYDDRRDLLRDPRASYIQSAVVIGPYLQLVVPFDPDRDAAAMRTACPAAKDADARLDCLQRIRTVSLDGRTLPVRYDIGRDARTDRVALVGMVDVRALALGRHVLQVAKPPRTAGETKPDPSDETPEPPFETIPFWR